MEAITYVLAGSVEHADSLGNLGSIRPGDVQWMTAGSGIIHQEMPRGDSSGRMGGFQLWTNLPANQKMMEPRYREVKRRDIPRVTTDQGAIVRVVCGEVQGVRGPVCDIVTDRVYLDISLPAGRVFTHPVQRGHTVFAYIFEGEGHFDAAGDPFGHEAAGEREADMRTSLPQGEHTVVLFGATGDQITVATQASPVRFLLVSGRPLHEPMAWRGPIVVNTREELRVAFDELDQGTFVKTR